MDEHRPLRLRKRAEFLAVQRGVKHRSAFFLIEMRVRGENERPGVSAPARVGFTVSKRNGNAVKRNRIRRRLREAVREIAKDRLKAGTDYVIVARPDCLTISDQRLKGELKRCFEKINVKELFAESGPRTLGKNSIQEESQERADGI